MLSEDHDRRDPDEESGKPAGKKKWRYLSREQTILADRVLGAWVAILTLIAAALFIHNEIAGYWITGATILVIAGGVALHVRHVSRKKRLIAWKAIFGFLVTHLVCLVVAGAAFMRVPRSLFEDEKQPFHIEISTVLWSPVEHPAFVAAELPVPGQSRTTVPVQFLVYIFITNPGPVPRGIFSMTMAVGSGRDGPWRDLCAVSLIARKLYLSSANLTNAVEINPGKTVDSELGDNPIPVGGTVDGWFAWRTPPKQSIPAGNIFKLVLKDSFGTKSTYVVESMPSPEKQTASASFTSVPPKQDLAKWSHWAPNTPCDSD